MQTIYNNDEPCEVYLTGFVVCRYLSSEHRLTSSISYRRLRGGHQENQIGSITKIMIITLLCSRLISLKHVSVSRIIRVLSISGGNRPSASSSGRGGGGESPFSGERLPADVRSAQSNPRVLCVPVKCHDTKNIHYTNYYNISSYYTF